MKFTKNLNESISEAIIDSKDLIIKSLKERNKKLECGLLEMFLHFIDSVDSIEALDELIKRAEIKKIILEKCNETVR